MNDKMYQDALIEYYKYPKHRKKLSCPDFAVNDYNPSCGDRISVEGTVTNQTITDLGFNGSGCVISQATASMLTEDCIGKQTDEILALTATNIVTMLGIPIGPTRLKCALLSLQALQEGILKYKSMKG